MNLGTDQRDREQARFPVLKAMYEDEWVRPFLERAKPIELDEIHIVPRVRLAEDKMLDPAGNWAQDLDSRAVRLTRTLWRRRGAELKYKTSYTAMLRSRLEMAPS